MSDNSSNTKIVNVGRLAKFKKLMAKGSATQGVYFDENGTPQLMTNTLGKSVPSDAVFTDTWRPLGTGASDACAGNDSRLSNARTPTSHTHGNISNTGTLTDTAAVAAGNDYIVIRDADNSKIQTSTIKGTDVADAVSKKHSHSSLTLSTTAQEYDGTHTLALPSSDPYTSARTPASHTHGNITNTGTITSTEVTSATGILVYDSNNKIQRATAAQTRSIIGAGTSSFSGSYNDLTDKPTIPTIPSSLPANGGNAATVNNHTVNSDVPSDAVFTDTTYGVFGSSSNGLTPSTASGNQDTAESTSTKKYLCDDGKWRPLPSGAFANGTVTSLSGYATETWVGQQGFLTSKDTPVYTVNNPSGTQTLLTNSHHVFTNVGSTLTIAFGQATSGKSNIYSFEFTTGSTAPTLSLPATVYMEDYSTLDANTHYEISIKYNAAEQVYYGVMQKWDVSAS